VSAEELRAQLDDMTAELLDRYEELTLLYDLGASLASRFEVADICEIAVAKATQAIGARRAIVALAAEDGLVLGSVRGITTIIPGGVAEYVAATGQELLLHEGEDPPEGVVRGDAGARSLLSVPLLGPTEAHEVLGSLTLADKQGSEFTAGDAKLATAIAAQLASSLYTSRLVESLRSSEGLRRELAIAAGIQRSLLPKAPPTLPGARIEALCVPAANVGGDYYDFLVDDAGRLSLLVADVAGHSIGSALMMAMGRSILRLEISEGKTPEVVLGAANATMYEDLVAAGLFITVFCARYDRSLGLLEYANAGHNLPMLTTGSGGFQELDADGAAIGILPDVTFEGRSVELAPGDALLLYTDGATEAADQAGVQFGEARLREAFVRGDSPEAVFAAVRSHSAGVRQADDVTLVALRIEGGR
jgi:serine phosphatase RsbU (regulator of sigma subunit)